jgi:hypothetical protein
VNLLRSFWNKRPPPLCVNILTLYVKMQTMEIMPPPVAVSSPPRLRFIFYFNPPLSLEATDYAGYRGFKAKCQLFDVNVCH